MQVKHFYDPETATLSYIVTDEATRRCAIIDSVLNFAPASGVIHTRSADLLITEIRQQNLTLEWILETHLHADHLTAASYIKSKLGGKIAIGSGIKRAFAYWNDVFACNADAHAFDQLFDDQDVFTIGNLQAKVLHTPGHTPTCASYHIDNAIFVGDTLFAPERGTSRADFPGGSAETLYQSIRKILSLPLQTQVYLCHDYPKDGEAVQYVTSVEAENKTNTMINASVSLEDYVVKRTARDKTLTAPRLMLSSLQVNLFAGKIPFQENHGGHYLKIPLKISGKVPTVKNGG